jgi:hypothetical protein
MYAKGSILWRLQLARSDTKTALTSPPSSLPTKASSCDHESFGGYLKNVLAAWLELDGDMGSAEIALVSFVTVRWPQDDLRVRRIEWYRDRLGFVR